MKPILDQWTIILAGGWNPAIFSPDFVARELFKVEELELELLVDGGKTGIRYASPDLLFMPTAARITFAYRSSSEKALQMGEDSAVRTLKLLPLTPLKGAGINFTFREEIQMLRLPDCLI